MIECRLCFFCGSLSLGLVLDTGALLSSLLALLGSGLSVDALSLALKAGSAKSANIVLMGRFSTYYKDIAEQDWLDALAQCVKPQFLEMNKKAFALGRGEQ